MPPSDPQARIAIRSLRADLAAHVRRASTGQRTIITVDGQPVAVLGPLEASTEPTLDELLACGAVVAPRRAGPMRGDGSMVPVWSGTRIDKALRDIRG